MTQNESNVPMNDKAKIIRFMQGLDFEWSMDAGLFYHKGHYMQPIERSLAEHIYYRAKLRDDQDNQKE